ncbi:hypothetical protein TL18_07130 [Methanobrevibacter sp. YE315]|uniref:hypothetical protein n=1 Tax=Methanobrevibacter sp. YE315 TaxID=1609968 RepID=UPI000764EF93|nr:hypothetical protein [Methanobrevibacter sp. YE315]AMD17810.1 hypothetical protein TL18_07130 [Methanobrevibacter sp. YE315]
MNSIIAAILSFFIPGLGQAISGDLKKGIILFVAAIVVGALAALVFRSWFVSIINLLISLYAAYDAYLMNQ